ncbi:uncharacterized protein LOC111253155 isoform X1 [Varroa destructor]|uniref:Uncharacterized protein n=1 Tax=Varroa destructor TaxID=109461 RepID=A0A7M7KRW5_VARDE|nr:uncharacterized protein LOC111253155 isoform X1 [Varroa destructor]XP_022667906.1 uncharacterized protein LOC111253155 isoform X1 [Varroa destructor]
MMNTKQVALGVLVFAISVLFVFAVLFGLYKALSGTQEEPHSSPLLHSIRLDFDPCTETALDSSVCFTLVIFSHTKNENLRGQLAYMYANDTIKREYCFKPMVVVFDGRPNNSFITIKIKNEISRPTVLIEKVTPAFLALLRKRNHLYVFVLDSFAPHPRQLSQVVSGQSQIWNCTLRYCSVFERLFSPTACGSHCITTLGSALTGCTLSSIVNDRQAEFFEGWSFSQEVQAALFAALPEGSSVYEFHREHSRGIMVRRMVRHHRISLSYRPG